MQGSPSQEVGVAELVAALPVHQRAAGLILCQGRYLGCGFHPWSVPCRR